MGISPMILLSLHTSLLAFRYPNIPAPLLGPYGSQNKEYLNTKLLTWSKSTTIPLALILLFGIPLRLVPYAHLGKNFTFFLSKPDHLMTGGIYAYVQHPSYVGLVTLLVANMTLLGGGGGAALCWLPPRFYRLVRTWPRHIAPVGLAMLVLLLWKRISEEEDMLKAEFGREWEIWHARTARFIPGVF